MGISATPFGVDKYIGVVPRDGKLVLLNLNVDWNGRKHFGRIPIDVAMRYCIFNPITDFGSPISTREYDDQNERASLAR